MANDDPTSLRMGFGYRQARASGLGGLRPDRSPNQVNKYVSASKAAREIRREVEADPEWGPFVAHWLKDNAAFHSRRDCVTALTFTEISVFG